MPSQQFADKYLLATEQAAKAAFETVIRFDWMYHCGTDESPMDLNSFPKFFSHFGNDWVRFSYATHAERTESAFTRLVEGLKSFKK
jgi:hypothetical protein